MPPAHHGCSRLQRGCQRRLPLPRVETRSLSPSSRRRPCHYSATKHATSNRQLTALFAQPSVEHSIEQQNELARDPSLCLKHAPALPYLPTPFGHQTEHTGHFRL